MATPAKLALLINRIPLNPIDSPRFSMKSQTKPFLTPIRYRKSNFRPKFLPKLVSTLKMTKELPTMTDLFTKYSGTGDISKLEAMIQSKSKLTIIKKRNNEYIRQSKRKIYEESAKIRSNQQSPIDLMCANSPQLSVNTRNNTSFHKRSISTPPRNMVDATFNTDY